MKIIFHLDLDSYFVSAERTVNKDLRNKPVVVSGGGERSIIAAASYEAKRLGIYVPMPLYRAKALVPNLVVTRPNFGLYTLLSTRLFEYLFNKYTKKIQVYSIDECFLDVSDLASSWEEALALAQRMQKDIFDTLHLPASIGISNNKFVAKMSTQINKPFGITLTPQNMFLDVFGDWKVERYFGIGLPTAKKLNDLGIFTIKDLAKADVKTLQGELGVLAENYVWQANGNGNDELDLELNDLKGIGNEVTFQTGDKFERKDILEILASLVEMVAQRMKNRNLIGKTLSVYLKVSGGIEIKRHGLQKTFSRPIGSYEEILKEATGLFDKIWEEGSLKFIGVRMTNLVDRSEALMPVSIFDDQGRKTKTGDVLDRVNSKYSKKVLLTGTEVLQKQKKEQNQSRYIESDRIIKHYDVKEK